MKTAVQREVEIPADMASIQGILELPEDTSSVVIFAHGSGSGRFSPRNQYVARVLQEGGIGTLLIDLLTPEEAEHSSNVFNIDLLADRVMAASDWIGLEPETQHLSIGYFGASTGAAAALRAAANRPEVRAVVSRGGRPDLAMEDLPNVTAPTLLIVGENDLPVIPLNQEAFIRLRSIKNLAFIPGATHLFEEPGALEKVAELARDWFNRYL